MAINDHQVFLNVLPVALPCGIQRACGYRMKLEREERKNIVNIKGIKRKSLEERTESRFPPSTAHHVSYGTVPLVSSWLLTENSVPPCLIIFTCMAPVYSFMEYGISGGLIRICLGVNLT